MNMPHLSDQAGERMKASLNISQTAALALKKRPQLRPVFARLIPLFEEQEKITRELCEKPHELCSFIPEFNLSFARKGLPYITYFPAENLLEAFIHSAEKLLPVLESMELFQRCLDDLRKIFHEKGLALIEDYLSGAAKSSAETLKDNLPSKEIISFAREYVIAPVLRAQAAKTGLAAKRPWDEEGLWQESYCPFCGSSPIIAWLDKPVIEEKNAFLAGGGGKKHFHCPVCNVNWVFRRSVCPACGKQGSGTVEILHEAGSDSERIDYCAHCRAYHLTVDLRKMFDFPHPDTMALALMHLDIIASRNKLLPLKSVCWNTF